jgi:hypothetical protein
MDVKQAVAVAKQYLTEVFSDEATTAPTLEEVWFDDKTSVWHVTLGVRRPTNHIERDRFDVMGMTSRQVPDYKVVLVSDKKGTAISIRNREKIRA